MQILVISDTHGRYDILQQVLLSHADCDLFVHCGDGQYETDRFLAEHPEYAPKLIRVRGNCDHDPAIPLAYTLPLPYGHKALIVHGHRYISGDFPQNLVETAKADGADLVLFGIFTCGWTAAQTESGCSIRAVRHSRAISSGRHSGWWMCWKRVC